MVKADSIPGVVRVLDLFQENGTAYIVMEFVEGETLKARLLRDGPMDWETAKKIFRPVISAMEQVHAFGLIHRDLSPDNLMLLPDGSVKILDLGAAKDLSLNSGASSMQVAKSGFSPLEQYIQRGGSGTWTDVYAMAATIYYTLTGTLIPGAVERLEKDTISWDFPALNRLPAQAREALKKALAVQAKDRTQTMEALEKGLFAEPVKVQPKPVAEKKTPAGSGTDTKKVKKPKIKKRWLVAVAAVLVLAFALDFSRWYKVLLGPGSQTATAQETQAAVLQDTQVAQETVSSTTPANVSDALYGYYEDEEHQYGITLEKNGNCRWHFVQSQRYQAGEYSTDGTNVSMSFTGGNLIVEATEVDNGLSVSYRTVKNSLFKKVSDLPAGDAGDETAAETMAPEPVAPEPAATESTAASNYISTIYGEWADVTLHDGYNWPAIAKVFSQELKQCKKMTVNLDVSMNSGAKCKEWQLWGRIDGKFKRLEKFPLPGGDGSTTHTVEFDSPVNLDAIAVTPTVYGGFSWSEALWLTDVWLEG